MRIGALPRISKEAFLIANATQMRGIWRTKRKTRAPLVTREIIATCMEYLENRFQVFSRRKAFHMNNPNQGGSNEAPKTSPQSDTKPAPQQNQGDGHQGAQKPDQQQK